MRVMLSLMVLLAMPLFASGSQENSDKPGTRKIVVACDATFPPMEFLNSDVELAGFTIDTVRAIERLSGVDIEIVNTSWDGIFAGLENENYDAIFSSVTITDERQKRYDFSNPYVNAGQVILVQKEQKGLATLADLSGLPVGVKIGTTGAIAAAKNELIELRNYDDIGLAVADLANSNLVAVVVDSPVAANYVLGNDNYSDKLKIVGEVLTEEYYGVVVRKGDAKLLQFFNEEIKKLADSGELEQLEKKWLG